MGRLPWIVGVGPVQSRSQRSKSIAGEAESEKRYKDRSRGQKREKMLCFWL